MKEKADYTKERLIKANKVRYKVEIQEAGLGRKMTAEVVICNFSDLALAVQEVEGMLISVTAFLLAL